MKKPEKIIYGITALFLCGISFYYATQYTRFRINRIQLKTDFAAVSTLNSYSEMPFTASPSPVRWDAYNPVTYTAPVLPEHKERNGQLAYGRQFGKIRAGWPSCTVRKWPCSIVCSGKTAVTGCLI